MSDFSANDVEADESTWLYLAGVEQGSRFSEDIAELCLAAGWAPYRPHGRAGRSRQRLEALRHADGVVANACADDAQTLNDLQAAREAGRPILALEPTHEKPRSAVYDILAGYDRAVVVRCSDASECLQRARELLADSSWRTLVLDAMAGPDA